jgi:hypothetical protein
MESADPTPDTSSSSPLERRTFIALVSGGFQGGFGGKQLELLKTAKALGLTSSQSLLLRADEVIH